ncbi:MAG TPA: hypothetical protein VGA29_00510, partial [Ignavibacteriaceae bacterium]
MSQQLTRIEGNQNKEIKTDIASISKHIQPESTPLFIPQEIDPNVNLGYNSKLVSQLGEKLTELKINTLNQNSDTESDNSSSENEESKISQLQNQFTNTQTHNEVNKLRYTGNTASTSKPQTLNYYPRPTFPDVQYEDKNLTARSQYDGTSVYEWNIDGFSEHQILNLIQEMNMAINAYKSKGNNQSQIATLILSGFTGTLKSWWDMYVSPDEKNT